MRVDSGWEGAKFPTPFDNVLTTLLPRTGQNAVSSRCRPCHNCVVFFSNSDSEAVFCDYVESAIHWRYVERQVFDTCYESDISVLTSDERDSQCVATSACRFNQPWPRVQSSSSVPRYSAILFICWWLGTMARTSVLVGELSLSHARPSADGWPLMWVNRPL